MVLVRVENAGLKCTAHGSRKIQDAKSRQKSPSEHHRTTLSGYIFARHVSTIGKKLVKQQYVLQISPRYGELRPNSGWDLLLASLRHPWKFQRVSRLGSVTARHCSSGRQPNFAALNRGCHLYSAGRPSRWALAHILVYDYTSKLLSYNSKAVIGLSSLFC